MFSSTFPRAPGRRVTCLGCWLRWESASWGRCSSSASSTASGWSTVKGGTASSTRGGRSDSRRSVTVHQSLLHFLPASGVNLPFAFTLPATSRAGDEPPGPGHAAGRQLRGRVLKRRDGRDRIDAALGHNLHRGQLLPPKRLQFKEPNVSTFPSIDQLCNGFYRASVMHCHWKNNNDIYCWEEWLQLQGRVVVVKIKWVFFGDEMRDAHVFSVL